MSEKKIIAVVGATGSQGGGLVSAILEDSGGEFLARALTRDPASEKARALAARGAEVVQADLDDEASLEEAFDGAYGAFCVTNFWEHFSPSREQEQARNLAAAAGAAGLEHVVWSTLDDTREFVPLEDDRMPTLQGEYKVPHFDSKGSSDAFFADAGAPTTYFLTTFYWDNMIHFGMQPQRDEDGTLALNLPMGDKKLAGIAADDIGRAAYGVFKAGDRLVGERVGVAGEHLTGQEMAAALSDALGEPVRYNAVPLDVYRGLGFPGAEDLGNMFQFYQDFEDHFARSRPVAGARALHPELQSFRAWLEANKDRIPVDPA
jgi:uncharacterized protein YbjT (DUF2867 family)